jgi:hypothetical protein
MTAMITKIPQLSLSLQIKMWFMKHIAFSFILTALLLCSCGTNTTKSEITAEMAYEGVSNYCHSAYDWSVAKENPSIMYVQMGEETDSAYQVVFRSYTGAFVNFYVNKTSGTTRMEEYVPILDVRNEAGTIDLFDYLEKEN